MTATGAHCLPAKTGPEGVSLLAGATLMKAAIANDPIADLRNQARGYKFDLYDRLPVNEETVLFRTSILRLRTGFYSVVNYFQGTRFEISFWSAASIVYAFIAPATTKT